MPQNNIQNIAKIANQLFMPMILVVVLPSTVLGFVASGSTDFTLLIVALITMMLLDFAGNVINNYADWKIDELNNKRIELHNFFTKKQLLLITLFLVILTFPLVILGNLGLKIALILSYFLIVNYSLIINGKDKLFINYLMIALYYGPIAFLIGFFMGSPDFNLLLQYSWVLVLIFLVDMGFSVTKDYEDVDGDKAENKLTIPVAYGKKISLLYQAVLITLTFIFLFALVALNIISEYFLVLLVNYFIAMYVIYRIWSTNSKESFHLSHNIIRLNALSIRFILTFILLIIMYGI